MTVAKGRPEAWWRRQSSKASCLTCDRETRGRSVIAQDQRWVRVLVILDIRLR